MKLYEITKKYIDELQYQVKKRTYIHYINLYEKYIKNFFDIETNLLNRDKCFFKIKCSDHPTCFPNGEPTNCTIHDKSWWGKFLCQFYKSIEEIFCSDSSSVIYLAKH